MYRFFGMVLFLVVGAVLGLQNIYWGIREVNFYTVWFCALILTSGIVGMTTRKVHKGMLWGILLWIFALVLYEITLAWLQRSQRLHPFDTKSFVEGIVLILAVGVPVSWLSSWLSIKNKALYVGATVLSTTGVLFLTEILLSLYVKGMFGRGF